jgi:hypothetical protein
VEEMEQEVQMDKSVINIHETNSTKARRSFKKPLLAIVAILIVAALAAGGWWAYGQGFGNSAYNLPGKATLDKGAKSSCMSKYKDNNLCQFLATDAASIPYEATLNLHTKSTDTVTTLMGNGDKNSVTIKDKSGKEITSAVQVGKDSYVKDPSSGKWSKSTGAQSSNNPLQPGKNLLGNPKNSYKLIGKEKCGNLQCFKYQVTNSDDKELQQYFWFDIRGHVLRHTHTVSRQYESDLLIDYKPVTVNAPSV